MIQEIIKYCENMLKQLYNLRRTIEMRITIYKFLPSIIT